MDSFQLKRLSDYSDESLIRKIQRVAALIEGNFITAAEFSRYSRVHTGTIYRHFGTFEKALAAAGLGHRANTFRLTRQGRKFSVSTLSDEQLIEELRSVARQLGKSCVTTDEFDAASRFAAGSISRRFGSWREALRRGGLSHGSLGRRYSDEECFEDLLQVWIHYGRQPNHKEMTRPPSIVGPKAYIL